MNDWEAKLSHLSAQVINRLLRENRKAIPKRLSVNLFKNISLHILNFYPSKLTDKNFPKWCNVKFSLLFILFNAVKTDTNLT